MIHFPRRVLCRLVIFSWPLRVWAAGYETPPTLRASDLAPPDVPLRGAHYSVDDEVATDGLLATFVIRSDFGTIEARGPGMLKARTSEVEAIARLAEMNKLDLFIDSAGESAKAVGGALANVVTNTAEVARAIPSGVGRFLERTARQAKTAGQKLNDIRQDKEAGAPRGAGESEQDQNVAAAAGVAAGRATRDALGYEEKRRDLARELGVDPYTTNPLLKKELDKVAWAAFAGGLGVDVLASRVPGGRLVQSTSLVSDWIYEKPPGDLKVWMEKVLRELGVDQETLDLFLRQKYWTLTTQTALVMALERMKGVEGLAEAMDAAVTADSEDQARFLAGAFTLLAREHASAPLRSILDGKPVGITAEGRGVTALPLDYVSWTERVASFAGREDLAPHQPRLLVTGRCSPVAKRELEAAGWIVREGIPFREGKTP
jgi:hypothetical protein